MRGYHHHQSCGHLFHLGLQVSVLPEGHLGKDMMVIEDHYDDDDEEEEVEDDNNCDGCFDDDFDRDEVDVDDDGTLAGSHLHRESWASLLQGRPECFHR